MNKNLMIDLPVGIRLALHGLEDGEAALMILYYIRDHMKDQLGDPDVQTAVQQLTEIVLEDAPELYAPDQFPELWR